MVSGRSREHRLSFPKIASARSKSPAKVSCCIKYCNNQTYYLIFILLCRFSLWNFANVNRKMKLYLDKMKYKSVST